MQLHTLILLCPPNKIFQRSLHINYFLMRVILLLFLLGMLY